MAINTPVRRDPIQLVHEAKAPVTPVAGPYGHPFHPILVTIPIGAWVSSLVFDIASRVRDAGTPTLVDASYWLIGLGVLGALAAAVFGLLDLLAIPRHTHVFRVGLTHLALNLVVVGLFVIDFAWRHSGRYDRAAVESGQLALSVVAIALLVVSGWLGGRLAYRFGVRVADESAQTVGYR